MVAEAMADFRSYKCTVQGHGQDTDTGHLLYAINTMARVRDDVCTDANGNPLDESMLITRVEFMRSRQTGTTTTVTLSPRDAISVVPQDV
jgi:prophage tail gpP-like protein